MSNVENRVVSMTFDNDKFERKIADTMRSLDKLSTSISMAGAKNGLQEVSESAKKVDLSLVGEGVERVSGKFLALTTIAVTALATITKKAVDTGLRMASSFSFEPIMQGFQEYETNMNSIQTILANTKSKGSTLEDVSGALDELNTYADQTIYNFSEMTRNIGTFTAAGVELDTATTSIKGIANLAAISGSNSQQAATAMYQLSQAISTGSVKLMDWNSVVNAGMGGEVFQNALFESGKAMGTLNDVPIEQTFGEWTDAGNTFRGSLQDGWITSEVLTNTLQGFTGDLTEAQIMAMGYTAEQTAGIMEMGEVGKDAATKVKTLSQLIDTVKEAIGSGWSNSFRIVFGDFEEAKELFSGVSEAIGSIVGASADSRNALLKSWKDAGGRTILIRSLGIAFENVGKIIKPIGEAFRSLFPKKTASDLIQMTIGFARFANSLSVNYGLANQIRRIFTGVFSVLKIGVEIVKGAAGAFMELFRHFTAGGPGVLDTAEKFAGMATALRETLVEGGGIENFFKKLVSWVKEPGKAIDNLVLRFKSLFGKTSVLEENKLKNAGNGAAAVLNRIKDRFGPLGDAIAYVVEKIRAFNEYMTGMEFPDFSSQVETVKTELGKLGGSLRDVFTGTDMSVSIDALNAGFFGALVLVFRKFTKSIGKFGDGFGDLFGGIADTLSNVSGVLKSMQTEIKAKALFKIAGALAVLTASLVVLSLMDSAALTKALAASAIGLAQLAGTMVLLDGATKAGGAAKLALLAVGLAGIATALFVLSIAAKNMSGLSWEEIAKGLVATTTLLMTLSRAVKLMGKGSGKMISTGIGVMAIAVALNVLALAMKIFATMSWEEIGKGLVGVAGGLGFISGAVGAMPDDMASKGAGILLLAIGLNFLATAMKIFATMSWEEIGKGLVGVGGGLILIANGMGLMPEKDMLRMSASLLIVSVALNLIATSMKIFATMSWEELKKGLVGMAGSLLILAGASYAMSGSLAGAAAIGIMAISLTSLAGAIKAFAAIKFGDLIKGLGGLVITLAAIGGTAYLLSAAIIPMLGLGAAMLMLGAGMTLFGIGAGLTVTALVAFATAIEAYLGVILFVFDAVIDRIPIIIIKIGEAFVGFINVFIAAAPALITAVVGIIGKLLAAVVELVPQFAAAFVAIVNGAITAFRETFPNIIAAGFELLTALITGIRDNMVNILPLAIEIIDNFLTGMQGKVGDLTDKGITLLLEFLDAIASRLGEVVTAGVNILIELIEGIAKNSNNIVTAGIDMVKEFISGVGKMILAIIQAGTKIIVQLIEGIAKSANDILDAGFAAVMSFVQGISDNIQFVIDEGFRIVIELINGIADSIDQNAELLRAAGKRLAIAVLSGLTFGLVKSKERVDLANAVGNLALSVKNGVAKPLEIESPSKVMKTLGGFIVEGLAIGIKKNTNAATNATELGNNVSYALQKSLGQIPKNIADIGEINPTIAPVLDLSNIRKGAGEIAGMMYVDDVNASLSLNRANGIANLVSETQAENVTEKEANVQNVKFEQYNYSPKALSTNEIYRKSNSQIALAKDKLKIA